MSTDYYLYSPSNRKSVSIGSWGLGGIKVWSATPEALDFIRWAVEESIKDIVFINEHELDVEEEKYRET